jgi:hypothetical protein
MHLSQVPVVVVVVVVVVQWWLDLCLAATAQQCL